MESVKNNYSIGMRFKMRFEGEEAPEQRYVYFVNIVKTFLALHMNLISIVTSDNFQCYLPTAINFSAPLTC